MTLGGLDKNPSQNNQRKSTKKTCHQNSEGLNLSKKEEYRANNKVENS